jgi:hypothetical protein
MSLEKVKKRPALGAPSVYMYIGNLCERIRYELYQKENGKFKTLFTVKEYLNKKLPRQKRPCVKIRQSSSLNQTVRGLISQA